MFGGVNISLKRNSCLISQAKLGLFKQSHGDQKFYKPNNPDYFSSLRIVSMNPGDREVAR